MQRMKILSTDLELTNQNEAIAKDSFRPPEFKIYYDILTKESDWDNADLIQLTYLWSELFIKKPNR